MSHEFIVGSTFFATAYGPYGSNTKWHCTGEIVSDGAVFIDRIWQDDDIADWSLSWNTYEEGDRVVKLLTLGTPNPSSPYRSPAVRGCKAFNVENPRNFFQYNMERNEEYVEKVRAKLTPAKGDPALTSLIRDWRRIRQSIDNEVVDDEKLDVWCRALEHIEEMITQTKADTSIGILCKMEVIEYYVVKHQLLETAEFIPELVKSVKEDLTCL